MALIIYPTEGYNSFATQAEADAKIATFVSDNGYSALSPEQKEAYLIQATMLISNCPGITLPEDVTENLISAQCYYAVYTITNDPLAYDPNDKAIKSEKVGAIAVEYDTAYKKASNTFPPVVGGFLKPYGCSGSSKGFTQGRAGTS